MKKSKTTLPFKIITIWLLIIASGYTIFSYNHLPKSKYQAKDKEISGIVTKCTFNNDYYQITIKGKEKVLINYYDNFKCQLGIKIKAIGSLEKPSPNTIYNLFNYRNYLLSQKINYIFKADKIKIINDKPNSLYNIKNNLTNYINTYQNKDYLKAFILGDSKEIDTDTMETYRDNGISHLLAISGMHITLLAAIILFILNKISKNEKRNYIVIILFLIFYMFLTGFTPSVIRAVLMFVILTINKILDIKINSIYILLLVLAGYLLYNPYIIFHIGFLFSFTITFFLILFKDLIQNCKNYLTKTFMISLIAFLVSTPILINNFFHINLMSPFINIIFVPLVSLIIYPLSLISLVIKPLDNLLSYLINIMEGLNILCSNLEINIVLKHLNLIFIIIYYLIIIYALYKLTKKQIRGLVLFLVVILIHTNINYFDGNNYLTMIDVGQGDSILIKLSHNQGNILIDTGGIATYGDKKPYDLATNKIIPYLNSEGIKELDYLILTHGDFDHAGMTLNLLKNIKIKKVIFNNDSYNDLEKAIIKKLNDKNIAYYKNIEKLNIHNNYLYFLNTKKYDNENDNSNVIYFKLKNYKFLLMGDAGTSREKDILKKYNLTDIDFLKAGHHGSDTSSGKNFIKQINPKYSLISVGKNNMYGHPKKKVLNNLSNSKIYRTDINGSIKIKVTDNSYKISTCIN